jgi:threonine/homoserine/homoserine lactone efflux protein
MDPAIYLYALLVLGIIALPGMDMAYVAAASASGGWPAAVAALSGVVLGGCVHMLTGLLGLGWVLERHPHWFNALLVAGALYMVYLAWLLMRTANAPATATASDSPSPPAMRTGTGRGLAATAGRGLATCLLNPKAYVFNASVLPAYLTPAPSRMAALMAITALTQILVYGAVAWAATRHRAQASSQSWLPRVVAGLLLIAGMHALWSGWRLAGAP